MNFSDLKYKTVFITGFQKNCGKTTILNYLIQNISDFRKAYFSIGMETGKQDSIFSNLKPTVYAREKDIIISDNSYFFSDSQCKIINSYNNGRVLMLEVLRAGYVPLIGIGENFRISEIITDIKKRQCQTIFIDGSYDRITQVSAISNSYFIYVARVEPENLNSIVNKINLLYSMSKTPVISENISVFEKMSGDFLKNNNSIFIKGAITSSKIEKAEIGEIKNIFFEDFTKIFLDYNFWQKLNSNKKIYFCSKFNLFGFVINLYNISRKDFELQFQNKEVLKFLIYNPYEYR